MFTRIAQTVVQKFSLRPVSHASSSREDACEDISNVYVYI